MTRMLEADNPEDVKSISPWLSGEELKSVIGSERRGSQSAADKLEAAGAVLPPFHALCRTEPVIA